MTPGANADSSPSGKRRLETQIVGVALLSTIVALLAAFSVYQWRNWRVDREALAQETLVLADALARSAHAHVAREEVAAVDTIRELIAASDRKIAVAYAPAQGREIRFASQGATFGPPAVKPVTAPEFRYRGVQLEAFAPIRVDGEQVGAIAVLVDGQDLLVSRFVNIAIALLLSAAALAGAGLMARRLTRQALAPLSALVEAVDQAATSKDFSARVPVARRDELGLLTERFNRLLATLEAYDADRQTALHEATLAREAAENANRLKERFLANMSHELRTPLNAIIGFSTMIKDEMLGPVGQKRYRDYAADIHGSGEHLLAIISDILDLSKVEAGKMELVDAEFDAAEVMRAAIRLVREKAESDGLALILRPLEKPVKLHADRRAVLQMLLNLLSNAVKFTERGSVELAASLTPSGGLRFSVRDTGIGMTAAQLAKVLEPFYQVQNALTRDQPGTGLGLPLVDRLIRLQGGRLEIESQPGIGTTASIELPPSRVLT